MRGWIGAGCVALACSPTAEPVVRTPTSVRSEVVEVVRSEAPAAVDEHVPVVAKDCLEEMEVREDAALAWHLVGTSDEPVVLAALGAVMLVATETRLYDAEIGGAVRVSGARAAGLGRRRVVRAFGVWPDDAWLATHEGELRGGGGGHKFHLWRWQSDRWVRLTSKVVRGDGVPEFFKFGEGRAVELRCDDGPELVMRAYGDGAQPRSLVRAPHSSACPQGFFVTQGGDVYAVDEVRSEPPNVQVSHRCAACEEETISSLPVPRMCDQAPTWSMWGIAAARPVGRDPVLAAHTSVVMSDGRGQQSGEFLLWRAGEAWTVEAVPGGRAAAAIEGVARAGDGSLWLVTERLLRRDVGGTWTSVALPEALRGADAEVDLRGVATLGDEVWLVAEDVRAGESLWSVYRSGAAQDVGGTL